MIKLATVVREPTFRLLLADIYDDHYVVTCKSCWVDADGKLRPHCDVCLEDGSCKRCEINYYL